MQKEELTDMGNILDLYIATKLSVLDIFFSFLSSCSPRPLETQKLWFYLLDLSEGGHGPPPKKVKKKNLEYQNQLYLHFPINRNFQPYQHDIGNDLI